MVRYPASPLYGTPWLTSFRGFLWRILAIGAISLVPPYAGKLIRRAIKPPSYRKVQNR